jgi:hypothetical protein
MPKPMKHDGAWHDFRYDIKPVRIDNYGKVVSNLAGHKGYLITLKVESMLDEQTMKSIIDLIGERGKVTIHA